MNLLCYVQLMLSKVLRKAFMEDICNVVTLLPLQWMRGRGVMNNFHFSDCSDHLKVLCVQENVVTVV